MQWAAENTPEVVLTAAGAQDSVLKTAVEEGVAMVVGLGGVHLEDLAPHAATEVGALVVSNLALVGNVVVVDLFVDAALVFVVVVMVVAVVVMTMVVVVAMAAATVMSMVWIAIVENPRNPLPA